MVVRKTGMNREVRKPCAISNSKLNERGSMCQYNFDYNDCEVGLELDASDMAGKSSMVSNRVV